MASSSFSSTLPDWALLDHYIFRRDDDSFPAGEPTEVSGTNSREQEIRVCFQLYEPPRPSRIYLWWPTGTGDCDRFSVVAAHRDAVLFQMAYPIPVPNRECPYDMYDYFLYRTAGGSPSLERLPSVEGTMAEFRALFQDGTFCYTNQHFRRIDGLDIAVLRRGDEDIAVAELQLIRTEEPELHVLFPSRSGSSNKWVVKKPRVIHGPDLDLERFLWNWYADAVIPFGSYLCWVDYCQAAILLCNVFDENPELQYLALPAKVCDLDRDLHGGPVAKLHMTVGVTEDCGAMTLRFVRAVTGDGNMFHPKMKLAFGFIATSWTLKLTETNELVWKKDGEVKSDDFWKLDGVAQLPRAPLECPHVSLNDPSIVYFVMRKEGASVDEVVLDYDETWLVSFDMPNMSLKSSFQYIKMEKDLSKEESMFMTAKYWYFEPFIPNEFPKFLKMHATSAHKQVEGSSVLDMAFGPQARKREYGSA